MNNISLKKLSPDDAPQIARLANNKNIWNNLRDYMPFPYQLSDAKGFIELVSHQNPCLTYGISFHDELCGVVGVNDQKDIYKKSVEIGYWLGEPYWGKGIASAALKLMTNYAFDTLDINRIYTSVFEANHASMKVLNKNGYTKEGILRKAVYKNDVFLDEHRYGILRSEWTSFPYK